MSQIKLYFRLFRFVLWRCAFHKNEFNFYSISERIEWCEMLLCWSRVARFTSISRRTSFAVVLKRWIFSSYFFYVIKVLVSCKLANAEFLFWLPRDDSLNFSVRLTHNFHSIRVHFSENGFSLAQALDIWVTWKWYTNKCFEMKIIIGAYVNSFLSLSLPIFFRSHDFYSALPRNIIQHCKIEINEIIWMANLWQWQKTFCIC